LLGHFHRADFRRHGRADTPRHHQARQHGAQFAEHRDGHHRAHGGFHGEPVELEIRLGGKHGPGEGPRDQHNQLRAEADFQDLPQRQPPADGHRHERAHRFQHQEQKFAEVAEKRKGRGA